MTAKAASDLDRTIGSRVKAHRGLKGMSQGKLATALGITFQQVQKYEKGTNRISASRLQQIAGIFGTSLAELAATGTEAATTDTGELYSYLDVKGAADMLRAWAALSPTLRKSSLVLLEAMAAEAR